MYLTSTCNLATLQQQVVQPTLSRVYHIGQSSSIGTDGERQVSSAAAIHIYSSSEWCAPQLSTACMMAAVCMYAMCGYHHHIYRSRKMRHGTHMTCSVRCYRLSAASSTTTAATTRRWTSERASSVLTTWAGATRLGIV